MKNKGFQYILSRMNSWARDMVTDFVAAKDIDRDKNASWYYVTLLQGSLSIKYFSVESTRRKKQRVK